MWDIPNRWERYKIDYYFYQFAGWFLTIAGIITYLTGNMMMVDATTDIEELRAVGQGLLGMIWIVIGWLVILMAIQRKYICKQLDKMGEIINHNAREIEVIQAQLRDKK